MQIFAANEIVLAPGTNRFSVLENTSTLLQVSNTITGFNTLQVNTEKGGFVELSASLYSKSNIVGAPQLPVISKMIEIPEGMLSEVKVVSYEVKEYKLSDFGITQKLFPAQIPQSKSSIQKDTFAWNRQLYETDRFYGEQLARVELSGYLRNAQLATLVISPVEYNPVTNTIRVYNNLVVEIHFTGTKKASTELNKTKTHSAYFNKVFSNILNYQPADASPSEVSKVPVKYVIVSDPLFKSALKPFIQWKTKRGFNVIEAYTDDPAVGKSITSIKAFLQNLYTMSTADDPAPTFVLFVGDVEQIPSFDCGTHVSDLYYCEYTGDYLPEVFYGRFSANSVTELKPQIDKTLAYEQYLMPDPSYLDHVLLIAGADATHQMTWSNGQITYGTNNYFNAAHNLVSHTYLQPEPAGGNYSQSIKNDLNNGVSYANYTSHGSSDGWKSPSFSIADVAELKNFGKYGLLVGNACNTNTFNQNSFGEALLRAENKGALGYIGASDLSYWDEDYWWGIGNGPITANPTYETTGLGTYDHIFHDHGEPLTEWYSTMGQMVFAGNLAVQESNSKMKKHYWEVYCLLGDPSTMVYFSEPPAMSVDYTPFLPLGIATFKVETEPFAYVAISKNNILHGVAEADENGQAILQIQPFTKTGYADIVITKQNRRPHTDSIQIVSLNAPYMFLDNYALKDKNGNKTQEPESGQIITVDLALKNLGNTDAVNATSTLSTNDRYVTLIQNKCTWPLVAAKGSKSALAAFTFQVNGDVPDLHKAQFTLSTLAGTSTFTEKFTVLILAPKLQAERITLDDKKAGNGNGTIDPGETIFLTVATTNTGHCKSAQGISRLFAFGDFANTNSPAITFDAMDPGVTNTTTFSFNVSADALPGSSASMYLVAEAGLYNSVSNLYLPVGKQVEDFETGNSLKFNWNMKASQPWKVCSSTSSEGRFSFGTGPIENSQKSELNIDIQVLANDTISFYRKVSSENGYDFLRFYIDGLLMDSWSGNQDWHKVSYPIAAGDHHFVWVYEKDEATSSGDDAAWIDYIEYPLFNQKQPDSLSVKTAVVLNPICSGTPIQLHIFASGETGDYTYKWLPASTLSNPGIFNPIATPFETTTYQVQVNSGSASVKKEITIQVEPLPTTPVVSISGDHLLSSAAEGNQWYSSTGLIMGATAQEYFPSNAGSYYVRSVSKTGCLSDASPTLYFQPENPSGENAVSAHPSPFTDKLFIDYSIKVKGPVKILIYNSIGNLSGILDEGIKAEGNYCASFDGSHLVTGMYYCRIFSNDGIRVVKVVKN